MSTIFAKEMKWFPRIANQRQPSTQKRACFSWVVEHPPHSQTFARSFLATFT